MLEILSAKEIMDKYQNELLENEAVHQLLIGNAMRLLDDSSSAIFGVIHINDEVYFFNNLAPYSCIVTQIGASLNAYEAGKLLADYVLENKIQFKGINASKAFLKGFLEKQTDAYKFHAGMDIMVLYDPIIKGNVGTMRIATLQDLDELSEMYQLFMKECLNQSISFEDAYTKIKGFFDEPSAYDKIFVYAMDNSVVAMAMATRKLLNGVSINGVYTKESYRKKGYCQALVSQVSQHLLASGNRYCTLFVDNANPLSNRAYANVGYKTIHTTYEYIKEKL